MRWLLPVAVLGLGLGCGRQPHWPEAPPADRCAAGALPTDQPLVLDVQVGGKRRQGLVWVPTGPGPHDLVVNLHEFRSSPARQAHYSGWATFAREQNVLLVAPDGRAATWNAGDCCGKAMEEGVDDVAFLDAVVARIDAVACTTGRVLATGIGNGAMMAQRWACASDVPDAVVSVGGSLQVEACEQGRPIPIVHYHGDADRFVPAEGGRGVLASRRAEGHRPADHARDAWLVRNEAHEAPVRLDDGGLACGLWRGRARTAWCTVRGGADTWPGSANGVVTTSSPLGDATRGAWFWLLEAWASSP